MDSEFRTDHRRHYLLVAVLALLLLVPLVFAFLRPAGSTFTVDEGNKLLLARSAATDPLRPALPYPGGVIDPALEWSPISPPFAHVRDERLVSQYPPTFAVLSAPGLALGYRGTFLLPWLGLVAAVLLSARLARLCGVSPIAAAAFAGPASALYPYGALFWEHTLAAAAVAGSLVCLCEALRAERISRGIDKQGLAGSATLRANQWMALGGISLAFGVWLRDEIALLFVFLLVLFLRSAGRRGVWFAASFVAACVPFFFWQAHVTGSPWGLHVGNVSAWSGVQAWLRERGVVLVSLILASPGSVVKAWIQGMAILGFVSLAWFGWHSREPVRDDHAVPVGLIKGLLPALGVFASGIAAFSTLVALLRAPSPAHALIQASGALLFVPWIGLAFGVTMVSLFRSWRGAALRAHRGRGEWSIPDELASRSGANDDAARGSARSVKFGDPAESSAPTAKFADAAESSVPTAKFADAAESSVPTAKFADATRNMALTAQFGGLATLLLLLSTPSITAHGMHWGPRILLSLVPIWAVLAAGALRGQRSRMTLVGLIAVSIVFQIGGIAFHQQQLQKNGRLEQRVRAELAQLPATAPVVTHIWWYAQTLPDLYATRPMFGVRSREALEEWILRFAQSNAELSPKADRMRTPAGDDSGSRMFAWVTDAPADDILSGLPLQGRGRAQIDVPGFAHRIVLLELLQLDSNVPGAAEAWSRLEESRR